MSNKKILIIVFLIVIVGGILGGILASCEDSGSSSNKYGYGSPKSGESLKDYIQREDPDLYKSIDERLKSLQ